MPPKRGGQTAAAKRKTLFAQQVRLETFSGTKFAKSKSRAKVKWPHENPQPNAMALAGLYFEPEEGVNDRTTCFICNTAFDGWEESDDPTHEHYQFAPHCALSKIQYRPWEYDKQLDWSASDLNPHCETMINARLETFNEHWPHENDKGRTCTTFKIAKAGLYFNPKTAGDDDASCAYCDVSLGGWEPSDDPLEEHRRRQPGCLFFTVEPPTTVDGSEAEPVEPATEPPPVEPESEQIVEAEQETVEELKPRATRGKKRPSAAVEDEEVKKATRKTSRKAKASTEPEQKKPKPMKKRGNARLSVFDDDDDDKENESSELKLKPKSVGKATRGKKRVDPSPEPEPIVEPEPEPEAEPEVVQAEVEKEQEVVEEPETANDVELEEDVGQEADDEKEDDPDPEQAEEAEEPKLDESVSIDEFEDARSNVESSQENSRHEQPEEPAEEPVEEQQEDVEMEDDETTLATSETKNTQSTNATDTSSKQLSKKSATKKSSIMQLLDEESDNDSYPTRPSHVSQMVTSENWTQFSNSSDEDAPPAEEKQKTFVLDDENDESEGEVPDEPELPEPVVEEKEEEKENQAPKSPTPPPAEAEQILPAITPKQVRIAEPSDISRWNLTDPDEVLELADNIDEMIAMGADNDSLTVAEWYKKLAGQAEEALDKRCNDMITMLQDNFTKLINNIDTMTANS